MQSLALGVALAALLHPSDSLLVTPGSPCEDQCGNTLSSTTIADIECNENDFTTANGIVFKDCVSCEISSTYYADNQTDLQWMLYNVRFATSYCLFSDPASSPLGDSPCSTSQACGRLHQAIEWNNLTTSGGPYAYCQDWTTEYLDACHNCLTDSQYYFISNYIALMDAACVQKPAAGSTISIDGNTFSTTQVNVTTPSATSEYTYVPVHMAVSTGVRVGIAIGSLVTILVVAGICIVERGKRKRRAYLRTIEKRYSHQGWPQDKASPYGAGVVGGAGGSEIFETPVSQRPLRGGWGDSPVSAGTETTDGVFPRYVSPYSNSYNSPVSASDGGPVATSWPALVPQRPDDAVYDPARAYAEQQMSGGAIGVAIDTEDGAEAARVKDWDGDDRRREAYEMHEVHRRLGNNNPYGVRRSDIGGEAGEGGLI